MTPHASAPRRALSAREADTLVRIQAMTASPVVWRGALILGRAGEHALGWVAFGLTGAVLDPHRRRSWLRATGVVVGAHALSVVLKRLVRRHRPRDPRIEVRVRAPSEWSFPSSHATSTTAAAVAYSSLVGQPFALLGSVLLMMASRVIVGVHYPSDVLAGAALGGLLACLGRSRVTERS